MPELQHLVEGSGGDGDLGRFSLISPGSKRITDHAFVSADRRFNFRANIIAAGFLPGHSAVFGDLLDVLIAPRRSGFGGRAKGRGRTRRNDDRRIRTTLGDRLIYSVLIVSSVSG